MEAPRIHKIHPIHPYHAKKHGSAGRPCCETSRTYEESQAFVQEELAKDRTDDDGDRSERCDEQCLSEGFSQRKKLRC